MHRRAYHAPRARRFLRDAAIPVAADILPLANAMPHFAMPLSLYMSQPITTAMLCIDVRTPLYRAAGQALATRARRVLAVKDRKVQGILTGIDFARAANH